MRIEDIQGFENIALSNVRRKVLLARLIAIGAPKFSMNVQRQLLEENGQREQACIRAVQNQPGYEPGTSEKIEELGLRVIEYNGFQGAIDTLTRTRENLSCLDCRYTEETIDGRKLTDAEYTGQCTIYPGRGEQCERFKPREGTDLRSEFQTRGKVVEILRDMQNETYREIQRLRQELGIQDGK